MEFLVTSGAGNVHGKRDWRSWISRETVYDDNDFDGNNNDIGTRDSALTRWRRWAVEELPQYNTGRPPSSTGGGREKWHSVISATTICHWSFPGWTSSITVLNTTGEQNRALIRSAPIKLEETWIRKTIT